MRPYSTLHRLRGLQLDGLRRIARRRPLRYVLASGEPFVLHCGDRLSELIYTGRAYEPLETAFCRRFLRAGDVAYDVGANVGYYTALFSRTVGATGTVVAFEPGHATYRRLLETVDTL